MLIQIEAKNAVNQNQKQYKSKQNTIKSKENINKFSTK